METPPTMPASSAADTENMLSDHVRFAEAMHSANVPTLLMVLVQLTGELRWLEEPYRPRKARGLSDNESGGLSEEVQAEVRAAALKAIIDWRGGKPVTLPIPSVDLLIRMMGVAMGEEIPPEYAPMIASEMFANNVTALEVRADVHEDYNARIDEAHERMVWTHKGMDTYRNARGRVVVNNPFRMQEFWQLTDTANLEDFVATQRA